MVRFVPLACVLSLLSILFVGCGRKDKPPAATVTNKPAPAKQAPKVQMPGGIPADFTALLEAKWPEIEREGKAFSAKFAEASKARKTDEREKMQAAIAAAQVHYNTLTDAWAEVAYWPGNAEDDGKIDAKTASRCELALRTYDKKVKAWMKQAKGLKELSTVK